MGSKRMGTGILFASILALALASATRASAATPPPPPPPPATTPCDTKPHDQVIDVGASVGCKLSILSLKLQGQGKGNTMLWRATDAHKNVKVVVDSGIFPSLSCPGDQHVCQSGYLDQNTPVNDHYVFFYHVYLCDDATHCGSELDPGIIIVP